LRVACQRRYFPGIVNAVAIGGKGIRDFGCKAIARRNNDGVGRATS